MDKVIKVVGGVNEELLELLKEGWEVKQTVAMQGFAHQTICQMPYVVYVLTNNNKYESTRFVYAANRPKYDLRNEDIELIGEKIKGLRGCDVVLRLQQVIALMEMYNRDIFKEREINVIYE